MEQKTTLGGNPNPRSGWWPTRKWITTQITALTGWAIAYINADSWSPTIKIMLVTIVGQAGVSYWTRDKEVGDENKK